VERAAPGREMRKVTKIRTALMIMPGAWVRGCGLIYEEDVTCEGSLH